MQAHEKFHTLTEQVSLANNGDDINRIYADFCAVLDSELLLSHGSSDTSGHRHKPWWSSNLSFLRKKARSALKLWSRDKSSMSNKDEYLKAQKEFDKQQVNKARKAFIRKRQDELLLEMTKRPRSFWRKLDAIGIHQHRKTKKMPEIILDSTGSMISERSEVLRVWKEHFDNLLNTASGAVPHNLPSQIVFSGLVDPISVDEIELVIKHFSNHKSAGPDGIQASFIKNPQCINFLCIFSNRCFSSGLIPSAWLKSIIHPIEKSGADPLNPSDYRGISLQSVVMKVFCAVLNNRLSD